MNDLDLDLIEFSIAGEHFVASPWIDATEMVRLSGLLTAAQGQGEIAFWGAAMEVLRAALGDEAMGRFEAHLFPEAGVEAITIDQALEVVLWILDQLRARYDAAHDRALAEAVTDAALRRLLDEEA